ncbi:MAG: hypothetical protein WAO13_05395 [Pseudolabrys sp.]
MRGTLRKSVMAATALLIVAGTTVAVPNSASARWGTGLLLAAALSAPYYGGYGYPYYYGYAPAYGYGPYGYGYRRTYYGYGGYYPRYRHAGRRHNYRYGGYYPNRGYAYR